MQASDVAANLMKRLRRPIVEFSVISGGLDAGGATKRFAVQFNDPTAERVPRLGASSDRQIADVSLRRLALPGNARLRQSARKQLSYDLFEVHNGHLTAIAVKRNADASPSYSGDPKMDKSDEQMSMGERLKTARKHRKLSQIRLAEMTGVSQSTISDIERGRNAGSTESAKLAAALGVSALWLSTGRGPKHEEAPIRPVQPHKQINTNLMIQCMHAATAFQAQTGTRLDDDDLLRLACRLYEQHYDTPTKTANELLGYLMTINELLDTSQIDRNK